MDSSQPDKLHTASKSVALVYLHNVVLHTKSPPHYNLHFNSWFRSEPG